MPQSIQSPAAMTDIPQEVREAAKWRHGPTCGSHAFADRACTCGAEAEFHAMFLAGKRAGAEEEKRHQDFVTATAYECGHKAGMERAAEIADDHATNAWAIGQREGQNDVCSSGRNHGARAIAQAIRSENDG